MVPDAHDVLRMASFSVQEYPSTHLARDASKALHHDALVRNDASSTLEPARIPFRTYGSIAHVSDLPTRARCSLKKCKPDSSVSCSCDLLMA
jgi:hypothetical protein